MKRIFAFALSALVLFGMVSCGGKSGKKAAGNDGEVDLGKVVENLDKQTFDGEKNTQDAAAFYFKKNFGIQVADLKPDFQLTSAEPGKYDFLGEEQLSSYVSYKSDAAISYEAVEAYVRKAYAVTAKAADDGKNVYGWHNSEKHAEEKPVEDILKGGWMDIFGFKSFVGSYDWSFIKGGIYYDVDLNVFEKKFDEGGEKLPYGVRVTVGKGLQKSMDDTMKDVEAALDDPEVQKQMEKALKDLSK